MPVEVSRIKGRLKELFPKANLSKKRLDELSARLAKKPADDAEDSAIDEVLNDANDVYPFEEMAKDEHRLVNMENKLKKQKPNNSADEDEEDEETETPNTDDVPSWAKSLVDQNKKLLSEVEELKTGKVTESKKEAARKLFEGNETLKGIKDGVKEKWFNRIDVNSETPVDEQITDLESEYTDLVQHYADSNGYAGKPPAGGDPTKPTDEEVDDLVDQI